MWMPTLFQAINTIKFYEFYSARFLIFIRTVASISACRASTAAEAVHALWPAMIVCVTIACPTITALLV